MQADETILAVGIAEAARRLGLSARTVATLVLRRELPSRKVGRRRIIPVVALEAFIRTDHHHEIERVSVYAVQGSRTQAPMGTGTSRPTKRSAEKTAAQPRVGTGVRFKPHGSNCSCPAVA